MQLSSMVIGVISVFLALLFALFVLIMFIDQMQCILANTSTIDNLQAKRGRGAENIKGEKAGKRTAWQNVKEVFGGEFNIYWLYPTDVPKVLCVEREFD